MTESSAAPSRKVGVICGHCNQPVAADVVGSRQPEDVDGTLSMLWCEKCSNAMLVWQEKLFEHRVGGTDYVDDGPAEMIWPQRDRVLSSAIPESLRMVHEEARKCFRATAYVAAASMVRRTIEAVCAEQGVNMRKHSLASALKELADRHVIDDRLIEWMQGLRVLGNDAVHGIVDVDKADARDALELAEAVLDYVYVFAATFAAFSKRRGMPSTRTAEQSN